MQLIANLVGISSILDTAEKIAFLLVALKFTIVLNNSMLDNQECFVIYAS